MKAKVFASRNAKEILRDPLSYVFCLGLPVVMLLVFQILGSFTADETPVFALPQLTTGISVFSFCFIMLYMAILVANDRATSFLTRLYCAPMSQTDFVLGYLLPGMVIAIGQAVVCLLCAWILGLCRHDTISLARGLLQVAAELPAMLLFVSLGIMFGSLLSEKAAPGIASILISASGFLSGAWIPLPAMGGYETFCRFLPFYPAVCLGRAVLNADAAGYFSPWLNLFTVSLYTLAALAAAILAFRHAMRSHT